jgi:hypothetical protein
VCVTQVWGRTPRISALRSGDGRVDLALGTDGRSARAVADARVVGVARDLVEVDPEARQLGRARRLAGLTHGRGLARQRAVVVVGQPAHHEVAAGDLHALDELGVF